MTVEWLVVLQFGLLSYFAANQVLLLLLAYRGARALWRSSREISVSMLDDLATRGIGRPISILVPAHNEARTIVGTVRSLSRLRFPEFEILVISDGSTDGTIASLVAAFDLVERSHLHARRLPTAKTKHIYASRKVPNLTVMEMEWGGKAGALNAGLNLAKYPLVCTVDADSLLEGDALLRVARIFANDDRVVAVGGAVRPLNGATVTAGRVTRLSLPRKWLERVQILEYARSFFAGRAGWGSWNALMLISGAFGVFHRETVMAVGGYRTGTVGEDLDLVVRLHKHCRQRGTPYRILSLPEPMCWTQVPSDLASLRAQRNRWQRGLWETLWSNRDMLLRPKYGRLGIVSLPYLWLFEGLAPFLEVVGFALIPLSLWLGVLSIDLAALFLLLAFGLAVLLSVMALTVEMLHKHRYATLEDRLLLVATTLVEVVAVRPVLVLERLRAFFQLWSRKGQWGRMRRVHIRESAESTAVDPAA